MSGELGRGWFTYDNCSVFSHVYMPSGLSVSLGFKEYASGKVLKEALVGRFGEGAERLHPGKRSWDGTYTSMRMEYEGTKTLIESADVSGKLYMLVTPEHWGMRPMTLLVSAAMLWNRPGMVSLSLDGREITAALTEGGISVRCGGADAREVHTGMRGPYLSAVLDRPVVIVAGRDAAPVKSADEVRHMMDEASARADVEAERYGQGELREAYEALRACMAWDTIYEPEKRRICTPVSRLWNIGWGGYVLFCWDTYFSAIMSMLGSKELAYANARAITDEATEDGFIPNFGAANDMKSRDRSQPPVGSMAVLEIARRYGEVEFVAGVYDALLRWNRWFADHRMIEDGTLCWGSEPYEPRAGKYWETHSVGDSAGAALESGLDNSPMYDGVPFDDERHIMCLSDVGLTGLYVMDCDCLAELAQMLGREADAAEIRARGERAKDGIDSLWNEEVGIYCNRRTDTGEFSLRLSPTNFYALFSGRVSDERAQRMMSEHFYNEDEFMGEYILPMIARNDPAYSDQEYWRGRIWAPTNYLVYMALKKRGLREPCHMLAEKSLRLILKEWRAHGHVHENYNADTGEGCDVTSSDRFYHWGALLSLIALDDAGML